MIKRVDHSSPTPNGGNLRQVMTYPGTGPFRHVSRKDKEVWIMERNPDYWNKGLPYVDKLEIYHLPAVLAGARRGLPVRQARLRAAAGPGVLAQGQGDAGRDRGGFQPVASSRRSG